MADQPVKQNTSDEIDLGQLFQMIGRGFNKIGIAFLRLFLYVKKRAFILGGLIILGVGIGYGLNQIVEKKKKIEVIVKPNLDSENYLYHVVAEVGNNIKLKDTSFFKSIDAPSKNLGQYEISVEPISYEKENKVDMEYLELLEKFNDDEDFSEVVRSEFLKNSTLSHRITFKFKDPSSGHLFAQKVMDYINSTEYFKELLSTSNFNARERIEQNELLINQIDEIIVNYSKGLGKSLQQNQDLNGKIILDNEEKLNITGLLNLKNALIDNTESKRIELQQRAQPINIINFGRPQTVEKPFFGKNLVLLPSILLGLFFIFEFIMFLNQRANKILF